MKAAKHSGPKEPHEMTRSELHDHIEHTIGLRPPPCNAPVEDFAAWWVASSIMIFTQGLKDLQKGKIAGIEEAMNSWDPRESRPMELLFPHIERALGRKLLAAEIESRTIYD